MPRQRNQPSRKGQSRRRANATKPSKKAVKQEPPAEKHAPRTEEGRRARGGAAKFILLCGFTLGCVVVLGWTIYLVPPAFSSPFPNSWDIGAANVLVDEHGLSKEQRAVLKEGLLVMVDASEYDPSVGYEITFPRVMAGRNFLLALSGSSVIDDVSSDEIKPQSQLTRCPKVGIPEQDRVARTCQVISGQVPTPTADEQHFSRSICDPNKEEVDTIPVRLEGTGRMVSSKDWAHHITSLPDLRNPTSEEFTMSQWGGIPLDRGYLLSQQHGCFILSKNPKWADFSPSTKPDIDDVSTAVWRPNSTDFVLLSVVSTERSAGWKGNVLLAFIGIAGGGIIPLLVAMYKAGRDLRASR